MPKARNGKVEFSADVPEEEYRKFRKRFPGYGASTWLITGALTEFNARMEKYPELESEVQASIDAMVGLRRMTA